MRVLLAALVCISAGAGSVALAAELGSKPAPRAATPPRAASASAGAVRGAAAPAKRDAGVSAIVRTDGAIVYSKPDFDADVLTTLKQGDRVRVSSGTLGDYAKFHKVAAGAVVGWIADIDVQVSGAPKKRDHKRGASGSKKSAAASKKKPFMDESMPIFFTKYLGLIVGFGDFKESISGVDSHENLLFYGLKFTGPDLLLTGPIMDFNLLLHYGAPSYYNSLSKLQPSGFIVMTDMLLLYPFFNRDRAMITFGLGPLLKFSNFNVTSGGEPRSLSQLDFGASLALSGAAKMGKFAVRLEGKYLIEKHQELLFQLALQQQY